MNIAATTRIDPRSQPGATVKTPGGLRAFVLGVDPKDGDRVQIEYEAKGLGLDSYNPQKLTLICAAPETVEFADEAEPADSNPWAFYPNWLNSDDANFWLEWSLNAENVDWQQNAIKMFGKEIVLPRLEAIIGDGDYRYNGLTLKAQPWQSVGEELMLLKKDIELEIPCQTKFAIAIANQYRDGNDHIGWHSDDSPEMGDRPAIASLSLGVTRKFQLRHKQTKEIHTFELTHGSLLVMHPGCQEEYQHRLCKAPKQERVRVNWTFRPLISTAQKAESNSNLAIIENPPESIIEAELIPELCDLESQIESGQRLRDQGERSIWSAAALIRQHNLWKTDYQSFEDYCLQRWGWQKSNAYEVAGAGEVFLQLKDSGVSESELPTAIAAYRPLRKLQPEDRLDAISQAKAKTGKLTADAIKAAIAQLTTPPPPPTAPNPYQFNPIPPRPVWFRFNGVDWEEGQAIARNSAGNIKLVWGENRETLIPEASVRWEKPTPLESGNIQPKENLALLHSLQAIAQQKSEEIYTALCKLNTDADLSDLAEISEELNTTISEILEFHFLGGGDLNG